MTKKKWLKHFVQIVNNSEAFMKTSHTHSLSFYFLIFQIATRHKKREYLIKNKNLKNKSMVLLCYSTLPYSTWKKKLFKCMHISNGTIFEEVTQVCSYSQQKNITLWMLDMKDKLPFKWWCQKLVKYGMIL